MTLFIWEVENEGEENLVVSLSFTFRNGTGDSRWDREGSCHSRVFRAVATGSHPSVHGICLEHTIAEMPCTYALAVREKVRTIQGGPRTVT